MASLLRQRRLLGVAEELHDGRFPLAALDLDEGQALGAEALGVFGHGVHLALRDAGQALGVDAPSPRRWLATAPLKTLNLLPRNSSVKSTSSMPKRVSGLSMP